MIKVIKNPLTPEYLKLKEIIYSDEFSWYYSKTGTQYLESKDEFVHIPYYGHTFLSRPDNQRFKYPIPRSRHTELAIDVFQQIFDYNNIGWNCFLRMNVNSIVLNDKIMKSVPHTDHSFPHSNCLIYLNNNSKTIVEDDEYISKEDDVILFTGEHYVETTIASHDFEKRDVIIATFL